METLTASQLTTAWEKQIEAEVRSFYFADLTSLYAKRKQVITFLTFFFSSGAAATLIAKLPSWVAITLSLIVALVNAYSLALGLDRKISTLSKLHGDWATLAIEYENLLDNPDKADAASVLDGLLRRDLDASRMAATDAPNDEKRMDSWKDHVFKNHGLLNG